MQTSSKTLTNLSPEAELLLHCSRTVIANSTMERVNKILSDGIDYDSLLTLAIAHGTVPLLHLQMSKISNTFVPRSFTTKLDNLFLKNAAHNLFLTAELFKIVDLFSGRNIRAIPYKGPVAAKFIFGDVALRRFGDLDILVHKTDVLKIKELLLSQGFHCVTRFTPSQERTFLRFQHSYDFQLENIRLEIHWQFAPNAFLFPIDIQRLFDRLVPVSVRDRTILSLSAEDLLLILCLNGTLEHWDRLVRICDISELIHARSDLNWDILFQEAQRVGSRRILSLGLFLAVELLNANVPDDVWKTIQTDSAVKEIAADIIPGLLNNTNLNSGIFHDSQFQPFYWRMRERFQDKMRYLVQVFLTPNIGDWELMDLPG